jgi:hypothetical protein
VKLFAKKLCGKLRGVAIVGWPLRIRCELNSPELRLAYAQALQSEGGSGKLLGMLFWLKDNCQDISASPSVVLPNFEISMLPDVAPKFSENAKRANESIYRILIAQPNTKADPLAGLLYRSSDSTLRARFGWLLQSLGDFDTLVLNHEYDKYDSDGHGYERKSVNGAARYAPQ